MALTDGSAESSMPQKGPAGEAGGAQSNGARPRQVMGAAELAAAVQASPGRTWTQSELSRRTGLSTRTLRMLFDPASERHVNRATVAKLDEPLGWPPGTAWRVYAKGRTVAVGEVVGDVDVAPALEHGAVPRERAAEHIDYLEARLNSLEDQPPWLAEWVGALRRLSPEVRATALALVLRLADSSG